MKHFRKIWDEPKHDFLKAHCEMPIDLCYELFLKTFPDAYDVTSTAFRNERSRIGAISQKYKKIALNRKSRKAKPLFSEQEKKGYVRVKIGQPNKWISKQAYIWWQNTNHKPDSKTEIVIFLDGDNRNFNFENLFLIPRAAMGIFNNSYLRLGTVPGQPELTKINALNAMLILATKKLGRKHGLVAESTGAWKDVLARKAKERRERLKKQKKK